MNRLAIALVGALAGGALVTLGVPLSILSNAVLLVLVGAFVGWVSA